VSTPEHEKYSEDLGAYLLGALPEIEATALERHAMSCELCQEELDRLRPAADALPHSVEQYEPPSSLKRSLMEAVEEDVRAAEGASARTRPARRRLSLLPRFVLERPAFAAAGAAALLVLGGLAGFGVDRATRGGGGGSRTVAAAVDRRALPRGAAQLDVAHNGRATLRVRGLPVLRGGRVYEVWLESGGAVRPAGALFGVMRDGSGAAAIPADLHAVDRVLVTRERAGGTARPTEPPVISVRT